jgi:hypothetical protein
MSAAVSPFETVVVALANKSCRPKRHGDAATALCPAHDDHDPSLTVATGDDGRVLLNCHAGCSAQAVVDALGLGMSDLFMFAGGTTIRHRRRRAKRTPANPQDRSYGIVPRFVTENFDSRCVHLYAYLDTCQNVDKGWFPHGDQFIADVLGWQARTVRHHGIHLAGAGLVGIHPRRTATGAREATEYRVIHNPARLISNLPATVPLPKERVRPTSRIAALREASVVRSTHEPLNDVTQETRDTLGTWVRNEKRRAEFCEGLDPEGDVADASQELLDQAPPDTAPPLDDATLERLFADESDTVPACEGPICTYACEGRAARLAHRDTSRRRSRVTTLSGL